MLCTTELRIPKHATVDQFSMMRGQLLSGNRLREVIGLEDSISRFGLLSPIVAIERAGRLVVVDGRKRLSALRRLAFQKRLPPSLARIPYMLASDLNASERRAPVLVSNRDLYQDVLSQFRTGADIDSIARSFRMSRQCVRDMLSLSRLSPVVRAAFFERLIDFSQARAFAAIPDQDVQLHRLKTLGPFARPEDILQGLPTTSKPERTDRQASVAA